MKKLSVFIALVLLSLSLVASSNSTVTPPPEIPPPSPPSPLLPLFFHLLDSPVTVMPGIVTSEVMNETPIFYPEPKEDNRSFIDGSCTYEFYLWPLLESDLNISLAYSAVVCWLKANATVRIDRVVVSIFDVESAENQTLIATRTFLNITVFEKEVLYVFIIPMVQISIFPPPVYTVKAGHSIKAELKFERPSSDTKLAMLLDSSPYNSFLVLLLSRRVIIDILVNLDSRWLYASPAMRSKIFEIYVEMDGLWPYLE